PAGQGSLLLYNSQSLAAEATLAHELPSPPAFAPDGLTLAQGGNDRIGLFRIMKLTRASLSLHRGLPITALAFSADGKTLVSGHGQSCGAAPGVVRVFDVARGVEARTLPGNTFGTNTVAVSPDGLTVAAGGHRDKLVRLFELATGREYAGLVGHE